MNEDSQAAPQDIERYKINAETARIAWSELQRYFAAGKLIYIDPRLDLVEVAYQFSIDNHERTEQWLNGGSVHRVTDDQAREFHEAQADFWAVVLKPWVLVQPVK